MSGLERSVSPSKEQEDKLVAEGRHPAACVLEYAK